MAMHRPFENMEPDSDHERQSLTLSSKLLIVRDSEGDVDGYLVVQDARKGTFRYIGRTNPPPPHWSVHPDPINMAVFHRHWDHVSAVISHPDLPRFVQPTTDSLMNMLRQLQIADDAANDAPDQPVDWERERVRVESVAYGARHFGRIELHGLDYILITYLLVEGACLVVKYAEHSAVPRHAHTSTFFNGNGRTIFLLGLESYLSGVLGTRVDVYKKATELFMLIDAQSVTFIQRINMTDRTPLGAPNSETRPFSVLRPYPWTVTNLVRGTRGTITITFLEKRRQELFPTFHWVRSRREFHPFLGIDTDQYGNKCSLQPSGLADFYPLDRPAVVQAPQPVGLVAIDEPPIEAEPRGSTDRVLNLMRFVSEVLRQISWDEYCLSSRSDMTTLYRQMHHISSGITTARSRHTGWASDEDGINYRVIPIIENNRQRGNLVFRKPLLITLVIDGAMQLLYDDHANHMSMYAPDFLWVGMSHYLSGLYGPIEMQDLRAIHNYYWYQRNRVYQLNCEAEDQYSQCYFNWNRTVYGIEWETWE